MNSTPRRKPNVVYWNNLPAPYMVDRFNAVALRGNVALEVWFSELVSPSRSWHVDPATWHFRYRVLPKLRLPGTSRSWVLPAPMLTTECDVVISLYAEPAFILGWAIARLRGKKTGFRVLKTFDRWTPRSKLRSAVKRFMFSRADAIETPGPDARRYAIDNGAHPERIHYLPHTVALQHLQQESTRAKVNRDAKRSSLGLRGIVFLYVGRLWWGKGLDDLIDGFASFVSTSTDPATLLIVGDGAPDEEHRLRQKASHAAPGQVVFAGFQQQQDLPRWYALADVFVFPTLGDPYGIVVEEALACSLPVISTDAAGEIRARIQHDLNGYIVPAENPMALAATMSRLAQDAELRQRMGRAACESIRDNTPEQWAIHLEQVINKIT
jgi:glycosyltransferase involved in cell wall biosynthesis